ncbi:MAG: hypothetical protein AAFV43_03845 [Planctomycetota bacterium]
MPTDPTPPTNGTPPTDDATRVGWFLTAVTGVVVLVGIAVIHYVTEGRPRPIESPWPSAPPIVTAEPSPPPPIVLRPSDEPDYRVADPSRAPTYR